jgi:predicted porin
MKGKLRSGMLILALVSVILLIIPTAQAVDFKISGQINRAMLWGDNGNDDDVKFVDNDNSSTRFRFTGSNDFNEVWTVGIVWENQMESNSSADTDIDIGENGDTGDVTFTERKMEFYVNHKKFGRLTLGQGDTASNGTSEVDLSGTDVVNYSSIEDMAGGFNFRTDDDVVVTSVGSAFSNYDGFSRRDRVRYDTPKFGPVYFSGSYMNGQIWDVAGRFAYQWEGFGKLAAAAHWTGADNQRDPYKQYSGSISFLHSSGFNIIRKMWTWTMMKPPPSVSPPYGTSGKVCSFMALIAGTIWTVTLLTVSKTCTRSWSAAG